MDLVQKSFPVAQTTEIVKFNNQELLTLKVGEIIYTAIRPIVEGMGMEWSGQQKKLSNPKFNCVHIPTVAQDGKIREMLCMPIKKLNGWLFSINPEKVKPEIKDDVIAYQEECFEVLHDYWQSGVAVNKRMSQNFENLSIEDLLNASVEQGKTATEICNQVTKAENISFGMGSLHGKGLSKRKKEKKILKELQAITLKWMQFKLPFIESKAV